MDHHQVNVRLAVVVHGLRLRRIVVYDLIVVVVEVRARCLVSHALPLVPLSELEIELLLDLCQILEYLLHLLEHVCRHGDLVVLGSFTHL